MNKKLTNSIINRIEQEKIQPRSKWYYRARYGSFWLMFGLTLIVGAISFAVMLYAVQHTDFEIMNYVDDGGLTQLLSLMPFVWALAIGLAIGLGVWGLKHTKRGYRLAVLGIFGGNLLGSIFLGSIVYGVGGGEFIEEIIEAKVPAYQSVREKHENFWGNPKKTGRLSGVIEAIDPDTGIVTVSGPKGREWQIPKTRLEKFGMDLEVGAPVKMKGTPEGERGFMPEQLNRANKQRDMNRKIRQRFDRNPELRAKFESYLTPETREQLQEAEAARQKPSRELSEQIRTEIQENTTPEERREILPPPEPKRGEQRRESPERQMFLPPSEFDRTR